MNLTLIPYRLNSDYVEFANLVSYVDIYNGVELYKVNNPGPLFADVPLTDAHLYFLDKKLITVYLHLENDLEHLEPLVEVLASELGLKGVLSKSQFGLKYKWEINNKVLVLVKDQIHRKFYIYFAIKKYSVF